MDPPNEAQCLTFLRPTSASRRAIERSMYFHQLARQDPIGSIPGHVPNGQLVAAGGVRHGDGRGAAPNRGAQAFR
jgi:hypothetical protein